MAVSNRINPVSKLNRDTGFSDVGNINDPSQISYNNGFYFIDENSDATADYSFRRPDFNLCSSVPILLFAGNTGVVPNYTSYGPRATRQMLRMILIHPYSKVCLKMHLPSREEIFSW